MFKQQQQKTHFSRKNFLSKKHTTDRREEKTEQILHQWERERENERENKLKLIMLIHLMAYETRAYCDERKHFYKKNYIE